MPKLFRFSVLVPVIAAVLLAGCASSPVSPGTPNADVEVETSPVPVSTLPREELVPLVLGIDDIPTGGWTLANVPGDEPTSPPESSAGAEPRGACLLDFTGFIPAEVSSQEVTARFVRSSVKQQIEVGVVGISGAEDVVHEIDAALDDCDGAQSTTTDGERAVANIYEFDMLSEAGVPVEHTDAVCRDFDLSIGSNSTFGSFCFVAEGDLLLSTTAFGSGTIISKVEPTEFAAVVNASAIKAFGE